MPWSPAFKAELRKTRLHPRYRLEVLPVRGYLPGAGLNLHSHPGRMGRPSALSLEGASVQAGQLNLGDWSHTTGQLSVGIRSSIDIRAGIPRGALVRLLVGFHGWDEGAYQPVWLGQYQDCKRQGSGSWQLVARSITGALNSRFTQTYTLAPLFAEVTETELTEDYVAGVTDPIEVASTAGLEKLTGGVYLVQVFPDSGEPFFLTATAKTGTEISGLSSSGAFGTNDADASSGSRVLLCALLEQNPVEAALTVLTSTGLGTNGAYDLGPESWGLGLPEATIDLADCQRSIEHVSPSTGTSTWGIYSVTPQLNPYSWLTSWMNPAGLWIGERQGQLTVRAAIAPGRLAYGWEPIHDREIVAIRSYSAWDPARPVEYALMALQDPGGTTFYGDEHLDTRPVLERVDVEALFLNTTDFLNHRALMGARLADYHTRIGEVFEIECVGWRLAHLAPGDHILMGSKWLSMRVKPEGLSMVLSVQPNWFGASTTIRAVHLQARNEFA